MDKIIVQGSIQDGLLSYMLGVDKGALVAQVSAPIDADLDKLAALIPGKIDDVIIGLVKSAIAAMVPAAEVPAPQA